MQEGDRVVSVNGTNVGASLNQNGVRITPHHTLSVITSHLISNHITLNSCVSFTQPLFNACEGHYISLYFVQYYTLNCARSCSYNGIQITCQ